MKFENETEERYKIVKKGLEDLGLTVPSGVSIMAHIVAVCEDIAAGVSTEEIIDSYGLNCAPSAFASTFKRSTGVSVKDIPTMTMFDKRRIKLKKAGFAPSEVAEIMEIVNTP